MKIFNMDKILVCTDLTEASDVVLQAAEQLRQRVNGQLDVLYVSELGFKLNETKTGKETNSFRENFLAELRTSIETRMTDQLKRCGVQGKIIYLDGDVSDQIMEVASKKNHNIILMGHRSKSLKQWLLGSNAFKLMASTPLPLMIIKKPLKFDKVAGLVDHTKPMDQLMIGVLDVYRNYKFKSAQIIGLWLDLPKPFGSGMTQFEIQNQIEEEANHYSETGEKLEVMVAATKDIQFAYSLKDYLEQNKVDVAVVKRFPAKDLSRFYLGSTTKRLAEIFDGNMLVFPD